MPTEAIWWDNLLEAMKAYLIKPSNNLNINKVEISLLSDRALDFDKYILIAPFEVVDIETGNGFHREEFTLDLVICQRTGRIDEEGTKAFLRYVQSVKKCLKEQTFSNEIIDPEVQIMDFRALGVDKTKIFLYGSLLQFTAKIKGV